MMRIFSMAFRYPASSRSATAAATSDAAVVQGAAADDAGDDAGRRQGAEVGHRGDAARGDHRRRDGLGHRPGRRHVRPAKRAVALDVGVHDGGDAQAVEAPRQLLRRGPRGARPAVGGDQPVAGVDGDGDAPRVAPAGLGHQGRVVKGHGAEDDPADAGHQPALDRRQVADAAAQLDAHTEPVDCRQDGAHRVRVQRPAGNGAVQVDDVQPAAPLRREGARLAGRVVAEHGDARHVAALEAHALAVLDVDGREEDHGALMAASAGSWRSA